MCSPGCILSNGPTSLLLPWGNFWYGKGGPVPLPHICRQEHPGLPSTSSTPSQQLVSGEDTWLLPKHSLLLLLSTHSVENNPNGNSENPQPNRLNSMKKLFSMKKRVRGNMQ